MQQKNTIIINKACIRLEKAQKYVVLAMVKWLPAMHINPCSVNS